jgi:hypothetical protein
MSADAQFQLAARYPTNLDRCRRCGNPRKLHGEDGSCGLTVTVRRGPLAVAGIAAAVLAALAGAGWLLASTTTADVSSVAAFASLAALILLAGLTALTERRR